MEGGRLETAEVRAANHHALAVAETIVAGHAVDAVALLAALEHLFHAAHALRDDLRDGVDEAFAIGRAAFAHHGIHFHFASDRAGHRRAHGALVREVGALGLRAVAGLLVHVAQD